MSNETEDRLEAARRAPRCVHVKTNGVRCGSPTLRGGPYCYFHDSLHNPPADDSFPPLEDANAIQLAIMQVLDGLRSGRLELRRATALLYGLQTASANLRRVNFEPLPWNVTIDDPLLELRRTRNEDE